MHDLRRQALESGKTMSRKARTKHASGASSKASSAANSRNASRVASRNVSDEEEGNLSDETAWSTNSIDDMMASGDADAPPDVWKSNLSNRMEEIIDRKRSSADGRADALVAYAYILKTHYAAEDIERKLGELIPAILKSVKSETSERETTTALKALELTVITSPSDTIFDTLYSPAKRAISNSDSIPTKIAAIHTLGTATFYGGASIDATQEVMDFYLEIIESDGHAVEAGDSAEVVTAALEEWGFLATQMEDLEDATEPAMDAFVEQLESSDLSVQVAAGENIALLYEKSCTEMESDDESGDEIDAETSDPSAPKMVKRYNVYRREDQLKHTLDALANTKGAARVAKKDRKTMRSNFTDVLHSVEHPTHGPRYSTAHEMDKDGGMGRVYGSRMTVRINQNGEMRIDKWWKLFRLQALRRALQGGFVTHYEQNEVVFDSLPIMIARNR
ncbi:hypothetical protein K490DRAFT_65577 [Saccharata proteae CBS 121410]|uniref:Interferon-related developmental regulator N-terminal domain-containing protein n=1 Tax=Saccharata proteae CBS 121410 TaxID=1314787 RepID=A0A9P4HVX2_9PEZI|nr:hypothetical protein K490DRAFT_65577 [Saccharata proteae CBS 121410]